jgi:hypothetical protein
LVADGRILLRVGAENWPGQVTSVVSLQSAV